VKKELAVKGGTRRGAGRERRSCNSWAPLWAVLATVAAVCASAPPANGAQARTVSARAVAGRAPQLPATQLPATQMTVAPDTGLIDGQQVTVGVTSGSYGTTYAVAVCDPEAYTLLSRPSASLQDACDSRYNTLMTVDAAGAAQVSMNIPAVLTTALGAADCRRVQCFMAIAALHSTGGANILVQDLTFSPDACAAPGSCTTPADAWDPSLGTGPPVPAPSPASTTTPTGTSTVGTSTSTSVPGPTGTVPATGLVASGTKAVVVPLQPTMAGNLAAPGTVTGPFNGRLVQGTGPPATAVNGEGLLRLALVAPGTSWGPGPPSSTVVDATLTDNTTHQVAGTQQFVLFWGASPFVYAGFAGPVRSSDRYSVTLSAEPPASQGGLSQPLPGMPPQAVLLASALEVVAPTSPQYVAYAYAPVMYGRSTSALHDVPLLAYASVVPVAGGGIKVSYAIIWSHEDGGTGFLPFVEWGTWGRMTDIEGAISFTVQPDGSITGAEYLWGGEPATGFPDSQSALSEAGEPFTGTWWGHHPVLRDATGNNDFSERGTTRFRFQLPPVAGPAPGQPRDTVMDANPYTYQVMAAEVSRWYADSSTDPTSPEPGQAPQYAIIDLDTSGRGVASVAVNLRLSGYPGWFRSDLGWGYPLVGTGHVRTVVKLPANWSASRVVGVQVVAEPPSAAATLTVRSLRLERFTGTTVVAVPAPTAVVGPEALDVTD
jgi:hypothetical protein